jgi:hypothetical protein
VALLVAHRVVIAAHGLFRSGTSAVQQRDFDGVGAIIFCFMLTSL